MAQGGTGTSRANPCCYGCCCERQHDGMFSLLTCKITPRQHHHHTRKDIIKHAFCLPQTAAFHLPAGCAPAEAELLSVPPLSLSLCPLSCLPFRLLSFTLQPKGLTLLAVVYSSAPCVLGHPSAAPASLIRSTRAWRNLGFTAACLRDFRQPRKKASRVERGLSTPKAFPSQAVLHGRACWAPPRVHLLSCLLCQPDPREQAQGLGLLLLPAHVCCRTLSGKPARGSQ